MLKCCIFLAIIACSYAASVRIVNGTNAREGEFPYAVSLRRNLRHVCGATIINSRRILTAAHCICDNHRPNDASLYTIQYGSIRISQTTDRSIQVSRIHCHNFNMDTLVNDIAVLELERSIPRDHHWESVKLPHTFDTSVGHTGTVIGWGRLWQNGPVSDVLQKLNVDIYTDRICNFRFDAKQHICFGASVGGACNGDSGTALVSGGQQIAVASFITNTCGTANILTPNVYARVSFFIKWIEERSEL